MKFWPAAAGSSSPAASEAGGERQILAAQYAREHKLPYFGICLGMQIAVIEFARHVCGLAHADSTEFNPDTPHPVIDIMPDQKDITEKGGTMRLGKYPCSMSNDTLLHAAYGENLIHERHRHRYEFNGEYADKLTSCGMVVSGASPDKRLMEAVELKGHPWFVAVQYHPGFRSRPNRAHPRFRDFIGAAVKEWEKIEWIFVGYRKSIRRILSDREKNDRGLDRSASTGI